MSDYAELSEAQYTRLIDKLAAFALDAGINSDDIAEKAKEFEKSADSVRTAAQYADGREYHDEMSHANLLSNEAARYKRIATQMKKSLSQETALAA